MDLSPPSLTNSPASSEHRSIRSPASISDTYCPQDASAGYPSPTLMEYQYKPNSPYTTLGPLPDSLHAGSSIPSYESWASGPDNFVAPSPPASNSPGMGDVLSAEYEAFTNYDSCLSGPYSGTDSYPNPVHQLASLPRSPPPSTDASGRTPTPGAQRSSFCLMGDGAPTSVKMESSSSFSSGMEPSGYGAPSVGLSPYPAETAPFSTSPAAYLINGPVSNWSKPEMDASQVYALPSTSQVGPQTGKRPTGISRTKRAPRKHTTREEANFQCQVKGCGKFFSRSYNFKSHLETHDDKREYPFPCLVPDCTKKFVRKTDLQRHHASVHAKERNHKCDYCSRLFARKDTLRRHMEDGCSKRFDIGTLDLRDAYGNLTSTSRPGRQDTDQIAPGNGPLPPLTMSQMVAGGSAWDRR